MLIFLHFLLVGADAVNVAVPYDPTSVEVDSTSSTSDELDGDNHEEEEDKSVDEDQENSTHAQDDVNGSGIRRNGNSVLPAASGNSTKSSGKRKADSQVDQAAQGGNRSPKKSRSGVLRL